MQKNNFFPAAAGNEEKERCVQQAHFPDCELLVYKLATEPRISLVVSTLPKLCTSCRQKLDDLFTSKKSL